jgi:diguanylate cyclase
MCGLAGRSETVARLSRLLKWLSIPVLGGMAYSGSMRGIDGAFWSYPAIVLLYMVLSARAAGACSLLLLASGAVMVSRAEGTGVALRFAASLGLVTLLMTKMLTALGDLRQKLEDEAITDPLTGAFNRRHLDACLAMALERRNRTAEPASLLLFDIDHFKTINDSLGHPAGDDVLRAVVRLVGGRMRTLDVLFRVGGEEFALLLSAARYDDALVVAEDLRLLIAQADLLPRGGVSISVGVGELQMGQSAHGWLAEADAALYRAKRGGRNRVAGRRLANAS